LYAGTYNASQIAVAAADATLEQLKDGTVQEYLNRSTLDLIKRFDETVKSKRISARIQGIGGNFQAYFADSEITNYRSTYRLDVSMYAKFQKAMFDQNIYFWPNHLFCHGISASHNKTDMEEIASAMSTAISKCVD
jgi:glutamate-1-semialdehyde 2,1-aminomutase